MILDGAMASLRRPVRSTVKLPPEIDTAASGGIENAIVVAVQSAPAGLVASHPDEVLAAGKVADRVGAGDTGCREVEVEDVAAGVADGQIVAVAAVDLIVPLAAVEMIIAGAADEHASSPASP